jgi:transcriptional regulator with XRE-family HTH domain
VKTSLGIKQAEMRERMGETRTKRQRKPAPAQIEDYSLLSKQELVAKLKDPLFRERFNDWLIRYTVSNQVKAQRQKMGWTQLELASRTGLHFATVNRIENLLNYRVWMPTVSSLVAIANAFDVALIIRFESWSSLVLCWAVTPKGVRTWTEYIESVDEEKEKEPPRRGYVVNSKPLEIRLLDDNSSVFPVSTCAPHTTLKGWHGYVADLTWWPDK